MSAAGFTGTRKGMTHVQAVTLAREMQTFAPSILHHGECIGADQQAHNIGRLLDVRIHGWPQDTYEGLRAFCDVDVRHPAMPPLTRNRRIVDQCDTLFAAPDGPERQRSGTWSTVRYARKLGKPVVIVSPDGGVTRLPS
jgi:hypothetical protein